jgi:hypothetical protein
MKLFLFFAITSVATAQYFPLQTGNQWIYKTDHGPVSDVQTIEIAGTQSFDGIEYFSFKGFYGQTGYVRLSEDGKLHLYDTGKKADLVWADFSAPEHSPYASAADPCSPQAVIESKSAKTPVLDQDRDGALQIAYPARTCADAGLTGEFFYPGIGLVERDYTSFTGPRNYKLIYARVGSTSFSAGNLSFKVALDSATYEPKSTITIRISLENTTKTPVEVRFPSGQTYDVAIRNADGDGVYRWSADKQFAMIYRIESIGSGERNWIVLVPANFPADRYVAEVSLVTEGKPAYVASVPFEVR